MHAFPNTGRCRLYNCRQYLQSRNFPQSRRTIPQEQAAASQMGDEHRSSTRDADNMRRTCRNEPHRSCRDRKVSPLGHQKAKWVNIHDLVWVVQLRKSNNEGQHGQHHDGYLAGAWSLHVLLDSASIPLNHPFIQLFRDKISRRLRSLGG